MSPNRGLSRAPVLTRVGAGLRRPECVLATASGDLYCSDARGGVTHLRPDGTQALHVGHTADLVDDLMPNGIALEGDGTFLIANLGADGGVFRLDPRSPGALTPVLREVDGVALPSTNFVTRDAAGRMWVTVSTRAEPRERDYRAGARRGFVLLDDGRGPRIVADGLGYPNECRVTPDGAWLYVNETFARRLSRYPLRAGAAGTELGRKEVVAAFGPGEFPDGLAFDAAGAVWVTCVVGNRVLRVEADGTATTWLDEGSPERVAAVEAAYRAGTLGAADIADAGGSRLGQCSSIAFGGPGLRTAYLGSLHNDHLTSFPALAPGAGARRRLTARGEGHQR